MEALNMGHLDSMSLDSLWKNETFFLRWADKGLHQPVTDNPLYTSGYARSVQQPPCHQIQLTNQVVDLSDIRPQYSGIKALLMLLVHLVPLILGNTARGESSHSPRVWFQTQCCRGQPHYI